MARLTIYAAQEADVNQGWVRLGGHDFPHRSIVRLSVRESGKVVHCEVLSIDQNFLRTYNQPPRIQITEPQSALVTAEWYRRRLGVGTRTEAEIDVTAANCIWGRIRACLDHPQVVVRLAVILALWSVALGLIGAALGIISLCK
jgi:hypothetical protein